MKRANTMSTITVELIIKMKTKFTSSNAENTNGFILPQMSNFHTASSASPIGVQSVRPTWFEDTTPKDTTSQSPQDPHKEQPQSLHGLKLVIREEVLPANDQPQFSSLELLAGRGLLAPDTWKCKRAQVSLKATIDVPMLGTIIEQNGDGLLEDSHMPVGWPLHIDGAVRQCCIHRAASLQELDDMLKEYDFFFFLRFGRFALGTVLTIE